MTVMYTTVRPASSGFGMWQAGPEWTTFGTEYGEFAPNAPEVTGADIDDWLSWLRDSFVQIERDTNETREIDGNVYEQNGEIVIAVSEQGDRIIYTVREEQAA